MRSARRTLGRAGGLCVCLGTGFQRRGAGRDDTASLAPRSGGRWTISWTGQSWCDFGGGIPA